MTTPKIEPKKLSEEEFKKLKELHAYLGEDLTSQDRTKTGWLLLNKLKQIFGHITALEEEKKGLISSCDGYKSQWESQKENADYFHSQTIKLQSQISSLEQQNQRLEGENKRLSEILKPLEILPETYGEQFKEMFASARKSPVYWIEAAELAEEAYKFTKEENQKFREALEKCVEAMTDGDTVEPYPYIPAITKAREALSTTSKEGK